MEIAQIAKIAVSAAPYSIDKPYDYLVPDSLLQEAVPGVRVVVPFGHGNRESEGIILARTSGEKFPGLKPLLRVLDQEAVLDADGIALALWMRQRYFCTLFEAARTILPAGLWYDFREFWHLQEGVTEEMAAGIRWGGDIVRALSEHGKLDVETLRQLCGDETDAALRAMKKAGLIVREAAAKRKISDKTRRMVELSISAEDAASLPRLSAARSAVIEMLSAAGRTSVADVCYYTGVSQQTIRAMEKSGILTFSEEEELRVAAVTQVQPGPPIILNDEQEAAFQQILASGGGATLLQGVTGSGKTQVYLRLVQEILNQGKTAMVLVPEIVLTPQMMEKFSSYFGSKVAMLHSSLRLSERYDQWKRIRRGEVQVVLGTRSAVFAPLKNLGLIVLDEEQESSYQSENPPRYHARDIAKYLCARHGATLVLGSATPAVESAWSAETGKYRKAFLEKRYNEQALPQVLIADLRTEIRNGNPGLISSVLRQELEENLKRGEQSILFLNRRGSSRYVLCGECGHVPECPRCSVAMTYHSANGRLMCHYCGHSQPLEGKCPECGGILKYVGTGTQKVEEELRELFPETPILRMDLDTVSEGHEKLLEKFRREQIPILIGTQMVAKGLDFENVTLVGVLSADLSLYVDHYRAAERTFSLLTQVVGRAGRGEKKGRAVIQTYTPENDVIRCAANQDYASFYDSEIRLRRLRRYPPFADLMTFTVSGTEEGRVLRAAADVREALRRFCALPEMAEVAPEVLGPAPAPVVKVNNRYRYRCVLIGKNDKFTRDWISGLLKGFAGHRGNRELNIFVDCNSLE